jgi:hypothetical protein
VILRKILSSKRLEIRNIHSHGDRLGIFHVSNGGLINLHNTSEDCNWILRITHNINNLEIFSGCPPQILEFQDVFFIPGLWCLYDSEGHRIIESCTRRGILLDEIINAPETITLPARVPSIDLPLVYLGIVNTYWGHFLTESISRLWALDGYLPLGDHLLLFDGAHSNMEQDIYPSISKFLSAGELQPATYKDITGPIRINKMFVPWASFSNRGQAFSAHTNSPHQVAERLLGGTLKSKSDRPVYLSRSRLTGSATGRVIRNEVDLETFLSSYGVLVCYPEMMSLDDQVRLFNNYSTFIGCWGSAFHNMIFCLQVCGVRIHVLSGWRINPNYFLFDAILGLESHYINCLLPTPGLQGLQGSMMDMYIDISLIRAYLLEHQII